MEIGAGQFKAQCLQLMDQVQQTREEVVITKRGQPVARLVPVDVPETSPFIGYLKGSVSESGDLIAPIDEVWEACVE